MRPLGEKIPCSIGIGIFFVALKVASISLSFSVLNASVFLPKRAFEHLIADSYPSTKLSDKNKLKHEKEYSFKYLTASDQNSYIFSEIFLSCVILRRFL